MNRKVLIVGLAIVVPILLLLGTGFTFEDGQVVLRHDPNVVESPLLGKTATPFVLADFEGRTISMADLAGRPIVLNFWASWCVPCIYENPLLVAAAREYAGRVHFVGVVPAEDSQQAVGAFQRRHGAWGPTLYDADGKVSIAYGVFKLPETYIIDSQGEIKEKIAGALELESLRRTLESLL